MRQDLQCREMDEAVFLDGSTLCSTEDTSGPPPSTALELQVWPEPVFRTQHNAFDERAAPPPLKDCSDSDSISEGPASTAAMSCTPEP